MPLLTLHLGCSRVAMTSCCITSVTIMWFRPCFAILLCFNSDGSQAGLTSYPLSWYVLTPLPAGNVLVSETGRLLRQVAETLHAAVLVTNHVVGAGGFGRQPSAAPTGGAGLYDVNTDYKPALGEQWRGMPHVRLQLSRATAVADVTCMTVLAHPLRVSHCFGVLGSYSQCLHSSVSFLEASRSLLCYH